MTFPRRVSPETLDSLTADDPVAMRSRRDLRRVHRVMGSCSLLTRTLRELVPARRDGPTLRLLELGAGDGSLMLRVARALAPAWPDVELTLLDRQPCVDQATIDAYAALGWRARSVQADALEWATAALDPLRAGTATARWDLIVANIFLHHFEAPQLALLFGAVADRSEHFFACEPRRAWHALMGSYMIGGLGANAVTRNDGVLSVHAGFRDQEMTACWPAHDTLWQVREYPAGIFCHCLRATRVA